MTQTSSTQAQQYAQRFHMHRAALQDLYTQLPADQGDFRAWDEGMSFIQLADHLSGSSQRLVALAQGQTPGAPLPASTTLQEARDRLNAATDAVMEVLGSLDDAALRQIITAFGGRQMPVAAMLDFVIGHETHHKGQAWLMARMVGIKPPFFMQLPA
ncbi:DinB family protein [Deinococcus ruber]|uniref:DinB-like domain-containing protein n=1 Tax=Deinococcus ruber TaxID=1848197 RepID=A0A918F787_9DEIO|nr:DinB family protein [Deinococcus ruber]GGR11979.1 hypothetical protein GCM10008957_26050 [Deinococcus ruber]